MKNFITLSLLVACVFSANAQWSVDPAEDNFLIPAETTIYENELLTSNDGTTWMIFQRPIGSHVTEYRVKIFDKYGCAKLSDPLGLLISTYRSPYTVINQHSLLDSDGNLIVAVHDARNSTEDAEYMSYTAYKISPDGTMLWDEDGVSLNGDIPSDLTGAMTITQLDDKSVVFAWMRYDGDLARIDLHRVSSDGKPQWNIDDVALSEEGVPYTYPYLVNSGSNQIILVFAKGASSDLYARKLDFDGTQVWEKDLRIYRGGWSTIPLWTKLNVTSSGDGGALVSWNDDRTYEGYERPYLSYIKGDGTLGFSAASETGDVRLDWEDGWQGYQVKAMPSPDGNGFYAIWQKTDKSQIWNYPAVQRISHNGELQWDENGVAVAPLSDLSYGYCSLQPDQDGNLAAFYMHNKSYYDISSHCTLVNGNTGNVITDKSLMFTPGQRRRSDLTTTTSTDEHFWIASWRDGGAQDGEEYSYRFKRINFDLTYGSEHTSGIDYAITQPDDMLVYNSGKLFIHTENDTPTSVDIINMSGTVTKSIQINATAGTNIIDCPELSPGIYFGRMHGNGQETIAKFIVK
ncbi:MAG: T9SS type A sorting domain-containing protein [Muribaculaceae bacterium]|nr:T9SS type A sorting domain-containing protein [Muribaculaceae bacterium]